MKIVAWHLPWSGNNPYQTLLAEAVSACDVEVRKLARFPRASWLWAHRPARQGGPCILHLHWLHGFYREGHSSFPFLDEARFYLRLKLARRLGFHVVWTAHNLLPHDCVDVPRAVRVRKKVVSLADGMVYHCGVAQREVEALYGENPTFAVIPHGTYRSAFGEPMGRDEARPIAARLMDVSPGELDEARIFLFLGRVRPYKGLKDFLPVFNQAAGPNAQLWIAGEANRHEYDAATTKILESDARIRRIERYVSNDEARALLAAADVCVAPYQHILTSASVILGANYELPVLAPRMGCIPDALKQADALLYEPEEDGSLAAAIVRACAMTPAELRELGIMGKAAVQEPGWAEIGRMTADFYKGMIKGRAGNQ